MPEGPEAKIVTNYIRDMILNKYIMGIYLDRSSKYYPDGIPGIYVINSLFTKVIEVNCKGKYIFIKLSDEEGNIYYIYNHLGMEGRWGLEKKAHSNVWMKMADKQNNGIYKNVFDFYFDDMRHYGKFEILNADQYNNKINGIGPDLLSDNISWEEYSNKMTGIIARTKTLNVAEFLLKQNYFSGVGNYLKSEILYHACINPFRNISTLSEQDIYILYVKSLELIKNAYEMGGMTIKSFINPFGNKKGGFIPSIYGRTTDPYMNKVESSNKKGNTTTRMTYWVPLIQV